MNSADVDVSVILVSYNTAHLLATCLDRLAVASEGLSVQVIVVDNDSRDGSLRFLEENYPQHEIVGNEINVGFARANNQVLDRVRGRHVLLLNIDAFVEPDALRSSIAYMDANPRCGVLGARLTGRDGELQPSCRYFPTPWNVFLLRTGLGRFAPQVRMIDDMRWPHDSIRACDWVPGCYYLVRAEVIRTVGLFDPRFFVYYEEVDHCRRVKAAGWEVVFFPDTTVVHIGGESAKSAGALAAGRQLSALQIESELLYVRKHHGASGVWAALVLAALGDAYVALKAMLRMRSANSVGITVGISWRHAALSLSTFRRTGAGRTATR